MDDRATRAARRRELDAELDVLEHNGGDELAVFLEMARRVRTGLTAYGPLDVLDGRDWRRQRAEEAIDGWFYSAAELVKIEREDCAAMAAVLDLDAVPEPREDAPTGETIVVDIGHAATQRASIEDASDPTWVGEGPRLARERMARRGAK